MNQLLLCLLHLGEADDLPVTTDVTVTYEEEQSVGSSEADNFFVITDVTVAYEEEHSIGSSEADILPVTIGVSAANEEKQMVGSGETNNLPLFIGAPIALIIVAAVIFVAIVYNNKLRTGSYDTEAAVPSWRCANWYKKLL
jgi:hypothetical protein